jgi:N-acetylneuraminic acid mutarotase
MFRSPSKNNRARGGPSEMGQTARVKPARPLAASVMMMLGLACSSGTKTADAGRDLATDAGDDVAGDIDAGDAAQADAGARSGDAGFFWSEAAPCPLARFEASGAVVDGQLWVLGGFTSATLLVTRQVDVYDPAADAWRAGPDLPGAETHIGVLTVESDVIVIGGFTGNFSGGVRPLTTTAVWRWSAAGAAWDAGPPLPAAGAAFASALVGTQVHVAGGLGPDGNTDTDAHAIWDLAGDAVWTSAAPLPDPRNHGGSAAAGGLFYAVAGRHGWNELSGDVADLQAFDPASGGWTARAPIPSGRSEIAAATSTMSDGRLLVVGGSLPGVMPSADVFVYDPALDSWSTLPPLPAPRKGAVATRIGSRIVVTTGSPTSVDPSATTFVGCCL